MRQRMERLVILPFSSGCISQASVAVGVPHARRSKQGTNSPPAPIIKGSKGVEDSEILSGESMNNSLSLLDIVPKPSFNSLFFKGFKNLSKLFVEKEEEELEEVDMEMEIGCPTDVQHVTHIGWDGVATCTAADNPMRGWDALIPSELISLTSQSLHSNHEITSSLVIKPGSTA